MKRFAVLMFVLAGCAKDDEPDLFLCDRYVDLVTEAAKQMSLARTWCDGNDNIGRTSARQEIS